MKKSRFIYASVVAVLAAVSGTVAFATEAPESTTTPANPTSPDSTATQTPSTPAQGVMTVATDDKTSLPAPSSTPAENTVSTYGWVQANANFYDSTRDNTPDFTGEVARVGMTVVSASKRASAQIEVEYNGDTTDSTASNTDPQGGTVDLRQAQANLDVLMIERGDNTYTTRVSVGGVRVGGADFTAPDAAYVPTGYSRQDGIWLQEMMAMGKKWTLDVGFGAFNGLYAVNNTTNTAGEFGGWGSTVVSKSYWQSTSLNNSIAYMGTADATLNLSNDRSVRFVADYGMQADAPSTLSSGSLDGGTVRNVSHAEASVLYKDAAHFGSHGVISGNGVSAFWEMENAGRSRTATAKSGTDSYSYADGTADDFAYSSLYGIGMAGDTQGKRGDMLAHNDRLTYAASYSQVHVHAGLPSSTSTSAVDTDIAQVAASMGYGVGTFETALNADYAMSSQTGTFADPSNDHGTNTTAQVYMTFMYAF